MDLNKPISQWTVFIILALTWGSSFILMKKGLESFTDLQVASLRIFISFLFLSPIILKNYKKIQQRQWKHLLIAGLIGSGLPAVLFPIAQTEINSSITGILNSLVPLFTVIIGLVFYKTKFRKMKLIGAFLGLFGAVGLLLVSGGVSFAPENASYALLVVLATISYATNVNFIKYYLKKIDAINITSFGFLFIGPPAGIYLFTTDFTTIMQSDPNAWQNLFYISILAVFGTSIAVILFNMLIKNVSPVFASSVTYIIPIFAIIWGLLDGEHFQAKQFIFVLIILFGVYMINKDNQMERDTKA